MNIRLDLQAHFFAGMAIAFTIALFTLSPFAGLITAIVAGTGPAINFGVSTVGLGTFG